MKFLPRLLLSATILVAIIIGYSSWKLIKNERTLTLSHFEDTVRSTNLQLESSLAPLLENGDREGLSKAMEAFSENAIVTRLTLESEQRGWQLTKGNPSNGTTKNPVESVISLQSRSGVPLGLVRVLYSNSPATRHLVRSQTTLALLSALLIVALSAWTFRLARRLSRPVSKSQEELARLASILHATSDFVSSSTADGSSLLFINQAGLRLAGLEPDTDISQLSISQFHPKDSTELILKTGVPYAIENGIWSGETKLLNRQGLEIPVSQVIIAHLAPSGKPLFISTIIRDISKLKQAQQELSISEERLRQALRCTQIGIIDHNHTTGVVYWSPERRKMFGWGPEEVASLATYKESIHPDDHDRITKAIQKAHSPTSDGRFDADNRIIVRNTGETRWVRTRSQTFFEGEGADRHPVRTVGAVIDITESKEVENTLIAQERRFRSLIEHSNEIIALISPEVELKYLSPAYEEQLGHPSSDLIGASIFEIVQHEDHPVAEAILQRCIASPGIAISWLLRLRHHDGGWRWMEGTATNFISNPEIAGVVVNCHDITDRKQAEEERARLATAIEYAAEAIFITNTEGQIIYANPECESRYGYSREELLGKNPRILKSGKNSAELYTEMWSTLTRGEIWKGRISNHQKDGELLIEDSVIAPITDATGKISSYVAVKHDVTKHLAMEEQRRQTQKLEAVGQLAAGIAHDFNNILGAILGNTELAILDVGGAHPAHESLIQIKQASQRAKNLVNQILTFSRHQPPQRSVISLVETIDEVSGLLRHSIPTGIELTWSVSPETPTILADSTQMHQVLVNLCTNAYQAMENQSGRILIELQQVDFDEPQASALSLPHAGRYAMLAVSDTGSGMDAKTMERIFDPFFTTKPPGKGTGLGLSVIHGIVKGHEGGIQVTSQPEVGTTFKVYFPAVTPKTAP